MPIIGYTFPSRHKPEKDSIQVMFGRIAPRYDALNHLLSFGMDFYWRRQMAGMVGAGPGMRILDAAAGTGDSSLALLKRGAEVVASDFTIPMLAIGLEKFERHDTAGLLLGSIGADAQCLPFRDSSFDAVSICFGLRNIEQRGPAYAEFLRVIKPGGKLILLEFSRPRWGWLRWIYGAYNRCFLPKLGRWISGDESAYAYLPESIKIFPAQEELALELEGAGFADIAWRNLSGGIVTLHIGKVKQATDL